MVTIDRSFTTQDRIEGHDQLLGTEFSTVELSSIAEALAETAHPELAAIAREDQRVPSTTLGKAVLDALVATGIFATKFRPSAIKDEYDAASRESAEDLYALVERSRRLRS